MSLDRAPTFGSKLAFAWIAIFVVQPGQFYRCLGAELISGFRFDRNGATEVNGAPAGELVGGAGFTDGRFGSALELDGIDGWLDTTTSGFPGATAGFLEGTISLWVRMADNATLGNSQFLGNLNSDPDNIQRTFVPSWNRIR